jgi:hypothetical protein
MYRGNHINVPEVIPGIGPNRAFPCHPERSEGSLSLRKSTDGFVTKLITAEDAEDAVEHAEEDREKVESALSSRASVASRGTPTRPRISHDCHSERSEESGFWFVILSEAKDEYHGRALALA